MVRIWQQIRFLGRRHRLTLVMMGSATQMTDLEPFCEKVIVAPTTDGAPFCPGRPRVLDHYASPQMTEIVRELAGQEFELAIFHFIYMAQYAESFSIPVILEEHNVESDLFRQFAALAGSLPERTRWRAEGLLLEAYETQLWQQFPVRFVVSEQDRNRIDARCQTGQTMVIPNGADCQEPPLKLSPGGCVLFCGKLNYAPNQQAVELLLGEIMPAVWRVNPQMRLVVAGADPLPQLIDSISDPRVELVANPPDLTPVVARCSVLAVPLRAGSGTRIKILEAFAWGLPIITTPLGCEGLDVEDGRHLLIRSNPQDFAQAVLSLQGDRTPWNHLREQGRELVEERYDWEKIFAVQETKMLELAEMAR